MVLCLELAICTNKEQPPSVTGIPGAQLRVRCSDLSNNASRCLALRREAKNFSEPHGHVRLRLEDLPPCEDDAGACEELAVAECSSPGGLKSGLPWDRVLRTGELALLASRGTG